MLCSVIFNFLYTQLLWLSKVGLLSRQHLGLSIHSQGIILKYIRKMILDKSFYRTQWEAKDLGWIIQPESEYFLGKRFAHQDDDSLMLIFDDAGYIAGTQSVIRTRDTDTTVMEVNPAYLVRNTHWTFIKKMRLKVGIVKHSLTPGLMRRPMSPLCTLWTLTSSIMGAGHQRCLRLRELETDWSCR